MKVYLYRWKLHADRESDFVAAWSERTRVLRELGSFGSRLHRGDDGWWYGYAQWPDEAMRSRAFARVDGDAVYERMRATVIERLPEVELDPVADFLVAAS
ncbi:MAG: hypothetical protein ACR2GP_12830 [Burkholderiaceae bacterium]